MSPDVAADKFSSAEQALFGPPPQRPAPSANGEASQPQGRILRSLIEPPPPVVEVPEAPRRGRKPGSKNKPKPANPMSTEPAPVPTLVSLSAEARAFAERPSVRASAPSSASDGEVRVPDAPDEAAAVRAPATRERPRLRARSTILRRYVLGVEPRPGEPGFRRTKRATKAHR